MARVASASFRGAESHSALGTRMVDEAGRRSLLEQPLGSSLRKYKLLGSTGLRVSPLCMGTMHLADPSMTDKATARRLVERYMDLGGNFFDTSPLDERGTSEAWLGEFLSHHRSRAVIATKYGGATDPKDPNSGGNHRKCLLQSLDASLRRLGTHYVDLLLLHSKCALSQSNFLLHALV